MNCPKCGEASAYVITTRNLLKCKSCKHQYSSTSGTRMRYSKLSEDKRSELTEALKTMSANAAAKKVGVNYHTALRMKWLIETE